MCAFGTCSLDPIQIRSAIKSKNHPTLKPGYGPVMTTVLIFDKLKSNFDCTCISTYACIMRNVCCSCAALLLTEIAAWHCRFPHSAKLKHSVRNGDAENFHKIRKGVELLKVSPNSNYQDGMAAWEYVPMCDIA